MAAGAIALLLLSGAWNDLSLLKEYANRADSFWQEARQHLWLAFGSMAAACPVGLLLGILAHRFRRLRTAILQVLNICRRFEHRAFGILIAPLGYLATHVPLAAALGIRGIGAAPAFIALFLYSLLPVVANTVTGLNQVPAAVTDAARGMGLSVRQRLRQVELPLALPVILAGIRIALVQNIGLATVAALIGGGGFGTFVFQGIGQTAIDLVLLGALPTVALSFVTAIVFDAIIDLTRRGPVIEIEHLTKRYGETVVVDDVSFRVEEGTIAVVVGTSGAGKSTLLRMINRLVEPSAGRVLIDGRDTLSIPEDELRHSIGYVIQGYGLFPHRTVSQNIATVPFSSAGTGRGSRPASRSCWICSSSIRRNSQASFRMSCRAAAAARRRGAGVAAKPALLLMDEPFGALDPVIRGKAQEDLWRSSAVSAPPSFSSRTT